MSLTGLLASSTLSKKAKTPNLPPPPPPPPTIDDAAMSEERARKFARRRGKRATITGATADTAPVGTKTLLGGP